MVSRFFLLASLFFCLFVFCLFAVRLSASCAARKRTARLVGENCLAWCCLLNRINHQDVACFLRVFVCVCVCVHSAQAKDKAAAVGGTLASVWLEIADLFTALGQFVRHQPRGLLIGVAGAYCCRLALSCPLHDQPHHLLHSRDGVEGDRQGPPALPPPQFNI